MKAPACLWQYFDAWKRALLFKKKKKNLNFDEKDHAEDKKTKTKNNVFHALSQYSTSSRLALNIIQRCVGKWLLVYVGLGNWCCYEEQILREIKLFRKIDDVFHLVSEYNTPSRPVT